VGVSFSRAIHRRGPLLIVDVSVLHLLQDPTNLLFRYHEPIVLPSDTLESVYTLIRCPRLDPVSIRLSTYMQALLAPSIFMYGM
jgi:hypothetical protein